MNRVKIESRVNESSKVHRGVDFIYEEAPNQVLYKEEI